TGESAGANQYGGGAHSVAHCAACVGDNGARIFRDRLKHEPRDLHGIEHLSHDAALLDVLRLVLDARLAPPADHEKHGNGVDVGVREGQQGIHRVASPGILHVYERGLAGAEEVADCECDGIPLVRCYNVVAFRHVVRDVGTEVLEEGVRN